MTTKLRFFSTILFIYSSSIGQVGYDIDSISLSGNSDLTYYSLESGTKIIKSKKNWDLGFANEKHESSIRINDIMGVRLWKTKKDTAQFATVTLADTVNERFNSSSYMLQGAFDMPYQVLNANNDYQIGWGIQYLSLGNIMNGDTVFILKCLDGNYRKLFIKYRLSPERRFIIRIANIDNTNSHEWTIRKNYDSTVLYSSYFNVATETQVNDVEINFNNYDLIFRDYVVSNTKYPMGIMTNNSFSLLNNLKSFTGQVIYANFKYIAVPAYQVSGTPISAAVYNNSLVDANAITNNNYIGINWFNTGTKTAKADESFYIRDRKSCIWHFAVKEYKSLSNEIVFYKKKLNICYSGIIQLDENKGGSIKVFPVPARIGQDINIEETSGNEAQYILRELNGKQILKGKINMIEKINTVNLASGIYIMQITDMYFNQSIKKIIIE